MVELTFDRPVGAEADVKELEYIAALHQTAPEMRTDGTITADDISHFLRSRYGMVVDSNEVRETILAGMGGSSSSEDAVDLMELVAILLIPTLLKAARQETTQEKLPETLTAPPPNVLQLALDHILHDVTGSPKPIILTTDLMKRILNCYGEWEIAEDEQLVQEMVEAANLQLHHRGSTGDQVQSVEDGGVVLTKESFAAALTRDVELYDVESETRLTSNFDDVFLVHRGGGQDNGRGFVKLDPKLRLNPREGKQNTPDGEDAPLTLQEIEAALATLDPSSPEYAIRIQQQTELLGRDDHVENLKKSKAIELEFTAAAIDIPAGTYRSKTMFVMLWACTLFIFFVYFYNIGPNSASIYCTETNDQEYTYSYTGAWSENAGRIACQSGVSVIAWVFFFGFLCIFGMTFVGLSGMGNYVGCTRWYMPVIGIVAIFVLFIAYYPNMTNENLFSKRVSLLLAIGIILGHLLHLMAILVSSETKEKYPRLKRLLQPGSLVAERDLKRAAAYKLNRLIGNAVQVSESSLKDSAVSTYFGQGLYNYGKFGKKYEDAGGLVWTWQNIWYGGIFREEGVWFSARLIASNAAQFLISLYVLSYGLKWVGEVADSYNVENAKSEVNKYIGNVVETQISDEQINALANNVTVLMTSFLSQNPEMKQACSVAQAQPSAQEALTQFCNVSTQTGYYQCNSNADINYVCTYLNDPNSLTPEQQMAFLEASGFGTDELRNITTMTLQEASEETFAMLYPSKKYMVTLPLYVGLFFAFFTAMQLSVTYVPSITTTILQLRSGVIPTLHDKHFDIYRIAPDTVALLTGSLFWGCLVSSTFVGGIAATIVFFFVWQGSAYFAQQLVAIVLGVLAVTGIKIAMMLSFRLSFYRGFYRIRPAAANISILALEWANFALSAGFIFVRMVKLLLIAACSIGRVDRPFLAKGVGQIGNIELDGYPSIHLRDLLAHDAHRHPYIEQLGTMYLMKLRYAKDFGKTAGSCWRLLFVYALMPWLHKYRHMARPQLAPSTAAGKTGGLAFVSKMNYDADEGGTLPEQAKSTRRFGSEGVEVKFEDAGKDDRIRELELENARMKAQLAKLETKSS